MAVSEVAVARMLKDGGSIDGRVRVDVVRALIVVS